MLWSAVQKNGKLYCTVTTSESGLGRAGFEGAEWMASVGVGRGRAGVDAGRPGEAKSPKETDTPCCRQREPNGQ